MRVITVSRKHLTGDSVVTNVLSWHVAAIAVDRCRIDRCRIDSGGVHGSAESAGQGKGYAATTGKGIYRGVGGVVSAPHPKGRWPPNVVLQHAGPCELGCEDVCPVSLMDRQSGTGGSGTGVARRARPGQQPFRVDRGWNQHSMRREGATAPEDYGDRGTASRFFRQVRP